MEAIDRIYTPINQNDLDLITRGPQYGDFPTYIGAVQRMTASHRDMQRSTFKALQPVIKESRNHLWKANIQLEDYFGELINSKTKPIEVLHYITKSEKYPIFSPDVLTTLAAIHRQSTEIMQLIPGQATSGVDTLTKYSQIRGKYMLESLQNLASASLTTAKSKGHDALYEPGQCGIGTFIRGMEGMFLCECENIVGIFHPSVHGKVFSETIVLTVNKFRSTVVALSEQISKSLSTDCYLALEIIDVVGRMFNGPAAMKMAIPEPACELARTSKPKLTEAINSIRQTAKTALALLLDESAAKGASLVTVPDNAMTLGLAEPVIGRIRAMAPFLEAVGSVLRMMGDAGWMRPFNQKRGSSRPIEPIHPAEVDAHWTKLFQHYVCDVFNVFLVNLRSKATRIKPDSETIVPFLEANNVAIFDRAIRSSGLAEPVDLILAFLHQKLLSALALYFAKWKPCSSALLDQKFTNRPGAKDGLPKQVVKERVQLFNNLFEDLTRKYDRCHVEKEVRAAVCDQLTEVTILYERFYPRYLGTGTDSKKSKHSKYSPEEVRERIKKMGA